ncbi:unnamed protein product [Protopolystoma xenopodis]|uniref:Uncharacterized protein n=1 Tax=Protopolystoma xenopodis TaxID=117903 RepID=A0A3S5BM26_9PLAT|nr:unnamed protein product [Protopolystoma xenopodis]
MNVDLNEISMNLVPFPRLHFLLPSQSPLSSASATVAPRRYTIFEVTDYERFCL